MLMSSTTKTTKNYDLYWKFKIKWAIKKLWNEAVFAKDGNMHMVQYTPCTTMQGKAIRMAPKWDTISKHNTQNIHKKCMLLYAPHRPTVIEQIQGCNSIESAKNTSSSPHYFNLCWEEGQWQNWKLDLTYISSLLFLTCLKSIGLMFLVGLWLNIYMTLWNKKSRV